MVLRSQEIAHGGHLIRRPADKGPWNFEWWGLQKEPPTAAQVSQVPGIRVCSSKLDIGSFFYYLYKLI